MTTPTKMKDPAFCRSARSSKNQKKADSVGVGSKKEKKKNENSMATPTIMKDPAFCRSTRSSKN